MSDYISRQAAVDIYDDYNIAVENGELEAYGKHRKRLLELPTAQPDHIGEVTEMVGDAISRQALLDAVDSVDWYHQNKNGEMVHGANDNEHQAWYKAEDIYHVLDTLPSAQPEQFNPCTVCQEFDCTGCKFRRTK